jgi:hypothetical protein
MSAPQDEDLGSKSEKPKACAETIERSESLNGLELFQASASCFSEERRFEGTFLLIAGQIRSMTDMSLLSPLGDADEIAMAELYGMIFYQTGGVGNDELYRDPILTQKLFSQLEEWNPSLFDGYDPGWTYKRKAKPDLYEKTAKSHWEHRLAQLQRYTVLIGRDDYYAASKEFVELQKRHPRGFDANSADGHRATELTKVMRQISQEITSPVPRLESSVDFQFEPDPDADFKRLLVGFNGPASGGLIVLESKEGAKNSWLSKSLTQGQLAEVLSEVDFEHQILVALAIGERTTATGAMFITDVSYNAILELLMVVGRVGVNKPDCHFPPATSYPFALAVAKRPAKAPGFPGYSIGNSVGNFGDGCKPPKSGEPHKLVSGTNSRRH